MLSSVNENHFVATSLKGVLILLFFAVFCLSGCSQQKVKSSASNNNKKFSQSKQTAPINLNSSQLKHYQKAITALNKQAPNEAKPILEKLSKSQAQAAELWFNLSLANYQLNDLKAAESNLEKALDLNPENPQALVLKGALATKKGKINLAETLYLRAIKQQVNFANAHYNLALLYDIYYQDITQAVTHYQRYLELTNYSDKKTAVWLEELNNSLK